MAVGRRHDASLPGAREAIDGDSLQASIYPELSWMELARLNRDCRHGSTGHAHQEAAAMEELVPCGGVPWQSTQSGCRRPTIHALLGNGRALSNKVRALILLWYLSSWAGQGHSAVAAVLGVELSCVRGKLCHWHAYKTDWVPCKNFTLHWHFCAVHAQWCLLASC